MEKYIGVYEKGRNVGDIWEEQPDGTFKCTKSTNGMLNKSAERWMIMHDVSLKYLKEYKEDMVS